MTAVFEELGGGAHFCEQASLSLALAATGTPFDTVGNEMNFPAHFAGLPLDSEFANTDPVIIHYHWLAHENGILFPSVYPKVNDYPRVQRPTAAPGGLSVRTALRMRKPVGGATDIHGRKRC